MKKLDDFVDERYSAGSRTSASVSEKAPAAPPAIGKEDDSVTPASTPEIAMGPQPLLREDAVKYGVGKPRPKVIRAKVIHGQSKHEG